MDVLGLLALVVGVLLGLVLLGVGAVVAVAHVRHWRWRRRWRDLRGDVR